MKKSNKVSNLLCSFFFLFTLSLFAQPEWSPDGNQILYIFADNNEKQTEGNYPAQREIMIMNADGTNRRRLTTNDFSDEYPSLSPDGKTILFSTNRDGSWKLYIMNIDGMNQKDLGMESTSTIWNDPCKADWSPDGKQFCFTLTKNGERILCIANSDGTGIKEIPDGNGMYPQWSPDGKAITFYSKGNIQTINIDGTNRKQITSNTDPASYESRPIYSQWSNDGKYIFYLKGDHVFRINADGTNEKQITNVPGQKWYLSLSVKNKLTYGCLEKNGDVVLDKIYVLELDGSSSKQIL